MSRIPDRAVVVIDALLAITGITVTAAKRQELKTICAPNLMALRAKQRLTDQF